MTVSWGTEENIELKQGPLTLNPSDNGAYL